MKNMKSNKLLALALVMVLSLALFAGCGGSGTIGGSSASGTESGAAPSGESPSVSEDRMFNVAMTAPFTGFDPLRTNDSASTYVNVQLYETLYRLQPDANEFDCLLAESLPEYSEDGLTASIKLREGVTFHDGTPFNAEAVKYTIDLIKDPDFGSLRASIAKSIDEVEIVDDYNIKLHLNYQDGVLTAKLAHTNSAIVSPTAQAAQDLMIDPVGTGPFKFVSSISGSNVVLTRNDAYWGKKPALKDVTYTIIGEESTALARLETGEADFIPQITVESIKRIEGMQNATFGSTNAARIYNLELRPNSYINPLMANKDFRVAIAKAIDVDGYTEFVLENNATAAHSVIGPKVLGYTEEANSYGYAYDLEGSKKLVADNGWANEEILLLVGTTPIYTPMGEYIQANLKEAGFNNVKIEAIDWSAWLTDTKLENRFDITVDGWSNVTRDGSELLEPNWHSVNSSLRYFLNDTELDKLIEEGKTTSDMAVRMEKLGAANKRLLEEAYVVPMYNADNLFAYNSAYTDVSMDPGGTFYLYDFGIA